MTNLKRNPDGVLTNRLNLPAIESNLDNIWSFRQHTEKCLLPMLFLTGGKSNYVSESDYPKILDLFPNSTFRVVEGAGHWVHAEKPKVFLEECLKFLSD